LVQRAIGNRRVFCQQILGLPEHRVRRVQHPFCQPTEQVLHPIRGALVEQVPVARRAADDGVNQQGDLRVTDPPERSCLPEVERSEG